MPTPFVPVLAKYLKKTHTEKELIDFIMVNLPAIVKKYDLVNKYKAWGSNPNVIKYNNIIISIMEYYNINIFILNFDGSIQYPLNIPFFDKNRETVTLTKKESGWVVAPFDTSVLQ